MVEDLGYCLVCEYRKTFEDGHTYLVNKATHTGESIYFELLVIPFCEEHRDWICDSEIESIKPISSCIQGSGKDQT